MIPVIVLAVSLVVARTTGASGVAALDGWQPSLRVALAAMLLVTASAHWGRRRADLIAMVPPALPRPDLLVTLTGLLELAGAVGLLYPPTAPYAGIGLALLFLALFPANVSAARRTLTIGGRPVTRLPQRTAIQVVFVCAAVGAAL
jgi:uncharacterized membrane protein